MPEVEHAFSYSIGDRSYRCVATRRDTPWGHGLKIQRYDEAGNAVDQVVCFCHPEFEDFEQAQAMTTPELVQFAAAILKSAAKEESLANAKAGGIEIGFVLSKFETPKRT